MSLPTTGAGRSVWSVQFYQENDGIGFGSGANIDDLPSADCTIEFYDRIPAGALANEALISKTTAATTLGWKVNTTGVSGDVRFRFIFDNTSLDINAVLPSWDDRWHHYALDWDFGTLTGRLFLDGVLVDTGTAVGNYQADAANDCLVNAVNAIGTGDASHSIGPIRLSDSRRYTGASFDPPRRINWPANDANAQLITRMNDGAGATVTDYSGNGYNGTITFGANTRWYNDPV